MSAPGGWGGAAGAEETRDARRRKGTRVGPRPPGVGRPWVPVRAHGPSPQAGSPPSSPAELPLEKLFTAGDGRGVGGSRAADASRRVENSEGLGPDARATEEAGGEGPRSPWGAGRARTGAEASLPHAQGRGDRGERVVPRGFGCAGRRGTHETAGARRPPQSERPGVRPRRGRRGARPCAEPSLMGAPQRRRRRG